MIDEKKLIEYIDPGHLRNPEEKVFSENDVVKMINAQPKIGQWIPVEERLPDKPGYYLALWHGHSCPEGMIDVLNFDGTVFPWTTLWEDVKNEVTHWMPLPAPYNPKKEGVKYERE